MFYLTSGFGEDVERMECRAFRTGAVQIDRDVYCKDCRGSFSAVGRPHRHDAEYDVQSLQEAVRGAHQQMGIYVENNSGTKIAYLLIYLKTFLLTYLLTAIICEARHNKFHKQCVYADYSLKYVLKTTQLK